MMTPDKLALLARAITTPGGATAEEILREINIRERERYRRAGKLLGPDATLPIGADA